MTDYITPKPLQRARILSWEEMMNATTPAAIVPTLIYEGSSHVLNGASKAGKSMFATQLAIAVATGSDFLGIPSTQQHVLYISLEMSAGLVRDRIRDITRDARLPEPDRDSLHFVAPIQGETPTVHLTDPEGAALLRRLIAESGAKLVILDTLYRFLPGTDFSDNGEMGTVMGTVNAIANETGAAILIIHHTRKGPSEGPTSQSGLGAQILGGAANVIMKLERVNRGNWELDVESHYAAPEEPIYYQRPTRADGSAGAGCVPTTESEARGLTRERVQQLFEEYAEPLVSGVRYFRSQSHLISGLESAGIAKGRGAGQNAAHAIEVEFGYPKGPIFEGEGPRHARIFAWCDRPDVAITFADGKPIVTIGSGASATYAQQGAPKDAGL